MIPPMFRRRRGRFGLDYPALWAFRPRPRYPWRIRYRASQHAKALIHLGESPLTTASVRALVAGSSHSLTQASTFEYPDCT